MTFKSVTHVLFDMDGLILNTEELYSIGFQKLASRYGKEFPFSLKCKIMGLQTKELAEALIQELDLPITVEDYLIEAPLIFHELFPKCKVMPGVEKLIRHLHKHKIPIALATSSSIESYNMKVANHLELFDLFQYKTWGTSDPNVKRGKPYPDIFLTAAAKFPEKPESEKCLVFEDSINGVKAAHSAGMQVVMIPDPRFDRSFASEATLILNSMEEFRPEAFGLPPY